MTSPERQAARGAILLFFFAVSTKLVAFFKELIFAREFGVGALADAYVLAYTWATWIPGIFVGITMISIVPIGRSLGQLDPPQDGIFFREFAGLTLALGLLAGTLTALAPWLIQWLGFDEVITVSSLDKSFPLLALLVPSAFFAAYCSARLVNVQKHSNLGLEAVPPLTIITYLLASGTPSLNGLCLATASGYFLYAMSTMALLKVNGGTIEPRLSFGSAGWKELAGASVIIIIGNICAGSMMMVDQLAASTLPEGSASTLGYATRLLMLPATMMSLIIGRSMLPIFSDFSARGDVAGLTGLVKKFALIAGGIGLLGATLTWLLAPWLVGLAFERGSFSHEDTLATATALRWGIFQLPFFAAAIVLIQALLSQKRFAAVAISGIFNLIGKIVLNAILAPAMGVKGVTFATTIVLTSSLFILFYFYASAVTGKTRVPPAQAEPNENA